MASIWRCARSRSPAKANNSNKNSRWPWSAGFALTSLSWASTASGSWPALNSSPAFMEGLPWVRKVASRQQTGTLAERPGSERLAARLFRLILAKNPATLHRPTQGAVGLLLFVLHFDAVEVKTDLLYGHDVPM